MRCFMIIASAFSCSRKLINTAAGRRYNFWCDLRGDLLGDMRGDLLGRMLVSSDFMKMASVCTLFAANTCKCHSSNISCLPFFFKAANCSFSICPMLFFGVGRSSGMVPPTRSIAPLTSRPTL